MLIIRSQIPKNEAKSDRHYGRLALKNGFITQEDLDEALAIQQITFREKMEWIRLGKILSDRGLISPQENEALIRAQIRLQEGKIPAVDS